MFPRCYVPPGFPLPPHPLGNTREWIGLFGLARDEEGVIQGGFGFG